MVDELQGDYKYLFTTKDCMGMPVALKKDTFTYKIMPKHLEITPNLIQECVESAHRVTIDPKFNNRNRYIRIIPNPIDERNDFTNIKVVVEDCNSEYREVVTAYLLRDLKGEEVTKGGMIYDSGSASKRGI